VEADDPYDTQGPSTQQVAVTNRRTRTKLRSTAFRSVPPVERAQSAEGLFQHWIERAGLYLLRLSGNRTLAGSGRTGVFATE
jgi:hypothetical protein